VDEKRVSFDINPLKSDPVKLTPSDRKAIRKFNFNPCYVLALAHHDKVHIPYPGSKGKTYWTQRADLRMTSVDLHSRHDHAKTKRDISREINVLLECRHPNVQLMLGVCIDHPEGPVLVMERAWGPVSAALGSGPAPTLPAIITATQISHALLHLHDRGIQHGQVGKQSVFLHHPGWASPVTAKLGNFAHANFIFDENTMLEDDIISFGVFLYDLFATDCSGDLSPRQLRQLSVEELKRNISLAGLEFVLQSIFQNRESCAQDMAEWLTDAHRRFVDVDEQAVAVSQSTVDLGSHRNVRPSDELMKPMAGSILNSEGDITKRLLL
jgi:serine/threonine protein kinase